MRFYFDVRDADGLFPDKKGTEFPTLAARDDAALSLAGMARDAIPKLRNDDTHKMAIEVRDESGLVLEIRLTLEVSRIAAPVETTPN